MSLVYKLYLPVLTYFFPKPIIKPSLLNLTDFTQIKTISNDTWNKIPNSDIRIDFYDKLNNNTYAGFISYRSGVGQVGLFFLNKPYQNRGLGKQILLQTIEDMKKNNNTEIWGVTKKNHPFWHNVFNNSFSWYESGHLHPSDAENRKFRKS